MSRADWQWNEEPRHQAGDGVQTVMVELLAAYSNLGDHCSKWQELARLKPTGGVRTPKPRPRQAQHRLTPGQVDELVALYQAG